MTTYTISAWDFNPELIESGANEIFEQFGEILESCRNYSETWDKVINLASEDEVTDIIDQFEQQVFKKLVDMMSKGA